MISRSVVLAAAVLAAVSVAYLMGRHHKGVEMTADLLEAREASREATAKLEAQRLASEAQRAILLQAMEDEAREAPVTSPQCLPADRVRRLDRLR